MPEAMAEVINEKWSLRSDANSNAKVMPLVDKEK